MRWLDEHAINPHRVRECLERCQRLDAKELDALG